jgi:hypothetical protein
MRYRIRLVICFSIYQLNLDEIHRWAINSRLRFVVENFILSPERVLFILLNQIPN